MNFYLGTHKAGWLADARFDEIPLFVSRRTLVVMKRLPKAVGTWALDSGGFSELQMYGTWKLSAEDYVAEVRRYKTEIGGLVWAAPQDWMCEPIVRKGGKGAGGVVFAGTKLSTREHQERTVANFLELRRLGPDLPFAPVLQGWTHGEYLDCIEMYERAGVDLTVEPIVGVGTMCRRQGMLRAEMILRDIASYGIKVHGFGFKTDGLHACADALSSADSLAWSFNARKHPPMDGHDKPGPGRTTGHTSCANCPEFAIAWRDELLAGLAA